MGKKRKGKVVNHEPGKKEEPLGVVIEQKHESILGDQSGPDGALRPSGVEMPRVSDTGQTAGATSNDPIDVAGKKYLEPSLIAGTIESIFLMAASRWGEHWKLKDYEKDNLAVATCNYLNVVIPELLKDYPELFALCITGTLILVPRVAENVKHNKSKKSIGDHKGESVGVSVGGEASRKPDDKSLPGKPGVKDSGEPSGGS